MFCCRFSSKRSAQHFLLNWRPPVILGPLISTCPLFTPQFYPPVYLVVPILPICTSCCCYLLSPSSVVTHSQTTVIYGVWWVRPRQKNRFRSPRASLPNLRINVFFLIKKNPLFSVSKEYVKHFQVLQYSGRPNKYACNFSSNRKTLQLCNFDAQTHCFCSN